MSKSNKKKTTPNRPRGNVADSINATAKRIAASLEKTKVSDEWEQDRIEHLKSCNGKVGEIPINMIRTSHNIRKRIDEGHPDFKALVESIRTHGILQPPIVTVVSEGGHSSILLVGGERRLRAAKVAGYQTISCMVRIFDSQSTRLTASVAENMNRKDLEFLDIGHCFLSLREQGYSYAEIERLFNRDERTIGRYIKMAKWPTVVQQMIRDHQDKFTARFLLTLSSRRISDSELIKEIEAKIQDGKAQEATAAAPKRQSIVKRFSSYCETKQLGQRDQELIYNALLELGILPPAKGSTGNRRGIVGASVQESMQ